MRHHLSTGRQAHTDHLGPRLRGIADQNCQSRGRRKSRKRLRLDILRMDRTKTIAVSWRVTPLSHEIDQQLHHDALRSG
jgi:hypothetical protein